LHLPQSPERRTFQEVITLVRLTRVFVLLVLASFSITLVIGLGAPETGLIEKVALLALIAGCVSLAAKVSALAARGFHAASKDADGQPRPLLVACSVRNAPGLHPELCDAPAMNLRASVFGPANTKTQAVVGAVVAFAIALLFGLGLKQGTDSSVFAAVLIALAVLMIGLKRSDTARN